jgi:hypothetical protein
VITAVLIGLAALLLFAGLTEVFGVIWSGGSAPSITKRPDLTANTSVVSEFTLAAGTVTDQEQDFGFDAADVEGVLITVEDNDLATVTMETNAVDATGGHTFTFPIGGGEMFWSSRFPAEVANPFGSTDVNTTYWTKSGADEPTVKIRVFFNA